MLNLNSQLGRCTSVFPDLHFGIMPLVSIDSLHERQPRETHHCIYRKEAPQKNVPSAFHTKNIELLLNNWFFKHSPDQVSLLEN